jgi:hypothetical protein
MKYHGEIIYNPLSSYDSSIAPRKSTPRREFLFFPKYAIFSNKIMKLIKDKTGEFSKIFAKHKVVFAYLFGSQATGKALKNSDIDIAIMLPRNIDAKKKIQYPLQNDF